MIRSLTMAAVTGVLLIVGTGCLDDPTDTSLETVTMTHIHVGAVDVAGGIALNLLPVPPAIGVFNGTLLSATFSGTGVVGGETFATLVAKIRAGTTYINVHTLANGGGEIRGQLVAAN